VARDQGDGPGEERPAEDPAGHGLGRWASTGVRHRGLQKGRDTTEREFTTLKGFCAVVMGTDKRELVFRGTIDVASIKIWLRNPTKQDPPDTP